MVIVGLCFLAGWVIYANYATCDLRESGQIKSNDQVKGWMGNLSNYLFNLSNYVNCDF